MEERSEDRPARNAAHSVAGGGSRIENSGNGSSWTRENILQGGLYTLIAAFTPVTTVLASDSTLNTRAIVCLVISSIIAGATALKAYLSTAKPKVPEEKETPAPAAPSQPPAWQTT